MIKTLLILITLTFFSFAHGQLTYEIKSYHYPTQLEADKVKEYSQSVTLQVCCEFPTMNQAKRLKGLNLEHFIVKASHFPSQDQINILEFLNTKYSIILDEVFPSNTDINVLNKSTINLITIFSRDFPTLGEVNAFNNIKVPLRFNITKKEYPLPRHMKVIKKFNTNFNIAFYNKALPGPGYANFFNALKTKKTFVAIKHFPWGDDAIGVNKLTNSSIEVMPSEYLMPQDLPIMNNFEILPTVYLENEYSLDHRLLNLIKQLNAKQIILDDSGYGELLSDHYTSMALGINKNIVFRFSDYH